MPSNNPAQWLADLDEGRTSQAVEGLIPVVGYDPTGRRPEEVAVMEKAAAFGAHAVFFEAGRNNRTPLPQAFVFLSHGPADDPAFGETHRRLWSWGGVPLLYRKTPGLVQLFRCAHQPDFISPTGQVVCRPYKTLQLAAAISSDPWWDAARLLNGTLWDDTRVCRAMLSASKAAHKRLIKAVKSLYDDLSNQSILRQHLRRKLLILSLLIAYLEERGVFPPSYFSRFLLGAQKFFEILADGDALVRLLNHLEDRFNGHVFLLREEDAAALRGNAQLQRFARLIEGRMEESGQLTLWQLYSFRDLPVELVSHIYQLFVKDSDTSIYTPPFVVRLLLDEALSWERIDRLHQNNEIILDPCCGSGIFLVEAYKRLVLHWRSRNAWAKPTESVLKKLLARVHGVDLEEGAIELAAFSLCLALCDALEPEAIRASIRLFPPLAGKTLHRSCFFEAKERRLIHRSIGVIVGNPPFTSTLNTPAAERSCQRYEEEYGPLPDKQLAYLFLHETMPMLAPGGVLSMLQQYNFLYNQYSLGFRRTFFETWDVREILDFVSVRGLFQKGGADTKALAVVAQASPPRQDRMLLHATFRRTGRVDAEQGFDIDYYDLHWLPRSLVLSNDNVWRANLLGGARVLAFVNRLRAFRTLQQYAQEQGWDHGEGFIEGRRDVSKPAEHLIGKPLLPSDALTLGGLDASRIQRVAKRPIEGPRSAKRFTPPMLLIREHMDLPHAVWSKSYLTYKNKIVGFAAPKADSAKLAQLDRWLAEQAPALRAYVAAISVRLFTQKATTLSGVDVFSLPFPKNKSLNLSSNERVIVDDIVQFQRDLIRLGEDAEAMKPCSSSALDDFAQIFCQQINAIYTKVPLRPLTPYAWPGITCQPFVFGNGRIDWEKPGGLEIKLSALLREQRHESLWVTRVARIYEGKFIFMIKPNPKRYWLKSIALRDADETLAELRLQGF